MPCRGLERSQETVGLSSVDRERSDERECVNESVTFNEVGSASMLAHRPWWEQISGFLPEQMEPSIHDSWLTRETVAPADPDESLSDNEWWVPYNRDLEATVDG